jgi:hypothetical protein
VANALASWTCLVSHGGAFTLFETYISGDAEWYASMMLSANFLAAASMFSGVAHRSEVPLQVAIDSANTSWNFSQSVLAMSLNFVLPKPERGLQENVMKW